MVWAIVLEVIPKGSSTTESQTRVNRLMIASFAKLHQCASSELNPKREIETVPTTRAALRLT